MQHDQTINSKQIIRDWRTDLMALHAMSSTAFSRVDRADLEYVLPACIKALSVEEAGTRHVSQPTHESIDLIRRGYVETDSNSLISRTNGSFRSLLKIPPTFVACGQTLILFVAKEDRIPFVHEFLRLRRREAFHLSRLNLRLQPFCQPPFLAHVSGQRIEGSYKDFLSVVWLVEKTEEKPRRPV